MADEEKKTQQASAPAEELEEEVPMSVEERLDNHEEVITKILDKVEEMDKKLDQKLKDAGIKAKGLFGGKRKPTPTKDLKTGKVYASKAAVGKAFAEEAGADPLDSMAYYKVIGALKMPDGTPRFVDASEEEGAKALAEKKAAQEAEVAKRNEELQKEEAEKAKAEKAKAETAQAEAAQAAKDKSTGKGK